MKTVPFLREHFVDLAEQDAQHHSRLVGDWKAMLDHAIRPDLSFSGIENGYLIACGDHANMAGRRRVLVLAASCCDRVNFQW